jgi:DNA-directed RNA polymerase specialized sigma24 family protein
MIAADRKSGNIHSSNYRDDVWRTIVETLSDFSTLQRKVFMLYHYTGSSIRSIADRTGLSEEKTLDIVDQTNRLLMHRLQQFRGENGGDADISIVRDRLAAC